MDEAHSDASSTTSEHFVDALNMTEFKVLHNYSDQTNTHSAGIEPVRNETLSDSQNPVDFVLVYGGPSKNVQHCLVEEENKEKIRSMFEKCLMEEGLEIEKETAGSLTFVKIFAPRHVLAKNCETLKLKMPMKEIETDAVDGAAGFDLVNEVKTFCRKTIRAFITIDPRRSYEEKNVLYAEYSRDKYYLFDENDPDFFDYSVRIIVIDYILSKIPWGKDANDPCRIGIQPLIEEDVYEAAYPLHDGDYRSEGSLRNQLRVEWADTRSWIKLQPIDEIKDYLGVKSAFYFAWLGFYTHLLIPASIFGLIVFLYGFLTIKGDGFSADICEKSENITMCPLCDKYCDYWKLSDTCRHAQVTHMFDNIFTVVFAFVMSVWATLFLELWKRHAAVLSHRWGLTDYTTQTEHPRPQYSAKLAGSKKKINVATGEPEVVLSFWRYKLPTVVLSYTVILLFIFVVIGAVFGIVLYRMWMMQADSWFNSNRSFSSLVIPATAATLNLISIMILNMFYNKVAIYLTNLELPRTQTDFENSLSIKMYIFQFVNYYSALMYIAFLKGKFVGYPKKYNRIFGYRQEECSPGGCLIEMSIQLAIIMVGQQIFNSILEILTPIIWKRVNKNSLQKSCENDKKELKFNCRNQWTEDYKLLDWGAEGLFWEYLEVVIQFGFVTLFASAFPLAPAFALLNNIFELRLDAKKILKYYRRPVPHRVPNIGAWYRILDVVGKIAVVSNAAIIAFSSNFIPKLVYMYFRESEHLPGFLEFSLSSFHTSDFNETVAPLPEILTTNVSTCRYYAFREAPGKEKEYKRTTMYWRILVMKLLFILIFQNVVFIIKTAIQWLIPDVPQKLSDRIKQENRLITELMVTRKTEAAIKNAGYDPNESSTTKKYVDEESPSPRR
ncbi:anoctamin-2-like [Planococcus citri]|uniref:anoctamin-2-like n=1 Tax=Planococcus citri TaxID=170843 RepID=UPI0031F8C5A2